MAQGIIATTLEAQVGISTLTTSKFVGIENFGTGGTAEANGVAITPVTRGSLSRPPARISFFGPDASIVPHRRIFGKVCIDRTITAGEIAGLRTYLANKSGVSL